MIVLLAVALPAFVAGASLDAPVAALEWERLEAAALGPVTFANLFVESFAPPIDAPGMPLDQVARWVLPARFAQFLGVFACSMLGYLIGMLANGRAFAIAGCVLFACLPPVAVHGHVLRPDTATLMLQLSAVLLLQLLAMGRMPAAARIRRSTSLALGATAALCVGASVSSSGGSGAMLLATGGLFLLAALLTGQRMWRAFQRRSIAALPSRAATSRMWPWAFVAMASLFAAATLLGSGRARGTGLAMSSNLLPDSWLLAAPMCALALLGAIRSVVRAGRGIGSRGRPGPDTALFAYAAAMLLTNAMGRDADALVAALPLSWLLADGVAYLVLLVAARRSR
jgi:hypothetical protein